MRPMLILSQFETVAENDLLDRLDLRESMYELNLSADFSERTLQSVTGRVEVGSRNFQVSEDGFAASEFLELVPLRVRHLWTQTVAGLPEEPFVEIEVSQHV